MFKRDRCFGPHVCVSKGVLLGGYTHCLFQHSLFIWTDDSMFELVHILWQLQKKRMFQIKRIYRRFAIWVTQCWEDFLEPA